jgi:hypothetical protein
VANHAEIAEEFNLHIAILREWDTYEHCDEEIWAILDEGHLTDDVVAEKHRVSRGTPRNWRKRFGIAIQSVALRSVESFTEDQLRAFIGRVNAGDFGVLTTLADENGIDPVMLYQTARELGIPLELTPVDRRKKKAIVDELHRHDDASKSVSGAHQSRQAKYAELATESGYGVAAIRTWDYGELTVEEGLSIVRDHGHRTVPEIAAILNSSLKPASTLLNKLKAVVGTRAKSAESFTKEQVLEYAAQVNAATEFGALTAIAERYGFLASAFFKSAKALGISLNLTPVDLDKKNTIVAELRAHAKMISGNPKKAQIVQRADKCVELAERFGYDIAVIRMWANGDMTADEIIAILTEGVGQPAKVLGRERQIPDDRISHWRTKFGFTERFARGEG